jgi:hypothetical protein
MLNRNRLITFLCVILATCLFRPVLAQEEHAKRSIEQVETVSGFNKPGDFIFAPIPVLNPTLGAGLAVGIAQSANFKGNDWKVTGGAFVFDLDLEFYGIGSDAGDDDLFLPINQQGLPNLRPGRVGNVRESVVFFVRYVYQSGLW